MELMWAEAPPRTLILTPHLVPSSAGRATSGASCANGHHPLPAGQNQHKDPCWASLTNSYFTPLGEASSLICEHPNWIFSVGTAKIPMLQNHGMS